jgi:tetratricopeptide (TPR) repeat protein
MSLVGRTVALHGAFWQYDPWYRRAWIIWPQALAALLAGWLMAGRLPQLVIGQWGKAANCAAATPAPGCAAMTRTPAPFPDAFVNPTVAVRGIVTIDRKAFESSAAADRPLLTAALGAYYRSDWQPGLDSLKGANADDPNVQVVQALLNLVANTYDGVRLAQGLLRKAADRGQAQASALLGGTMMGWSGLPKDTAQGRALIEKGAAAGDTYAMRLAAAGYLDGAFGARDSAKAFNLIRQAADAGDPVAMAQLAWFYQSGLGGAPRDEAKALDYLHRAAEGGVTSIQHMLGMMAWNPFAGGAASSPADALKWYERAAMRGHSVESLGLLAAGYRYLDAPYLDTARSYALFQLCARYAYAYCHYHLAVAYQEGSGTQVDLVKAHAEYAVAEQLGATDARPWLQQIESALLPAGKTAAAELARNISANLTTMPTPIELQTAEALAGPTLWTMPRRPDDAAAPAPSSTPPSNTNVQASSADWTACRRENGDADLSIAACDRLISSGLTGNDLGWAHFSAGLAYGRKGRHEQAISHFDETIRQRVHLSWARNNRGNEYLLQGNLDAALRDFDAVTADDPSFPMAYANRAALLRRKNQLDRAIAEVTQALRLDPKLRYAYVIRTMLYDEKGQWTEVVADCTNALEINPKDPFFLSRRGRAYHAMGKYDLSLADLDEALRLNPRFAATLVQRGLLRKDTGHLDLAIKDYSDAIGIDPKYADAFGYRADAYYVSRQYERAVADATKAIELAPKWFSGWAGRGRALTELGSPDQGVRDLYEALSLNPRNAYLHYYTAQAEAKLEEARYAACPRGANARSNTVAGTPPVCMTGAQYSTAISELDQALDLNPQYADAYAFRGALYLQVRQRDRGVADLRKALAIDPRNESARRDLRAAGVAP